MGSLNPKSEIPEMRALVEIEAMRIGGGYLIEDPGSQPPGLPLLMSYHCFDQIIERSYEGLLAGDTCDLVFKATPDDTLARRSTPKWLEEPTQ